VGGMLYRADRRDLVYILTLDAALAEDVYERLRARESLAGVEIVRPMGGPGGVTPCDIEKLAEETVAARVLIIDVRSATLPRLQPAYNKIVGYNRADFNWFCYTLLIGDGPTKLFTPGTALEVFVPLLGQMRIDYSAAAFFYDPFLHYTYGEKVQQRMARQVLTDAVPERLAEGFKEAALSVGQIRLYFRAAGTPPEERLAKMQKRLKSLEKFFRKRLKEAFGEQVKAWAAGMSKEGYGFEAEALGLHFYPFYFEEWVEDLLDKARNAVG
jgi:hypothetical protein